MKRIVLAYMILVSSTLFAHTQSQKDDLLKKIESSGDFAPLFAFQPTHNQPDNITNVATWRSDDDEFAGKDGFITPAGSAFFDGEGRRIRFIGSQCGMTGCFPSHEYAERLASEFSRYGMNIIRMHYVSHRTPADGYPVLDSFIEPVQLERFDYFISRLKAHGIYVYFQLNISRKFGRVNGFDNAHLLPKYKNGVDNVNHRMIELQKRFHKEILEHVNPYTGLAYKDEPCISMMEIANENSIVNCWFSDTHRFSSLVEPYKSEIIARWNAFLVEKYGDTESLKRAWLPENRETSAELLVNAHADTYDYASWSIQKSGAAQASWQLRRAGKRDELENPYHVRLFVDETTLNKADPRLFYKGIGIVGGEAYCLSFKIRSDSPMKVNVRIAQYHEPWKDAGLNASVKADYEWKTYKYNFTSSLTDDEVRLVFNNFLPGTVDLADVSLKQGLDYEWPAGQTLEDRNVDWPDKGNWTALRQKSSDFVEFLSGIESEYFLEMYSNLKDSLGVKSAVGGTQLGYGFNQVQSMMDYCDIHSYWCHPAFPGGKWDNNNFNVRNEAVINSYGHPASPFTKVARSRILGKPFTVSEFDIPNLNFYCAEADVMMAALGAFQNWSGLIQFSWILDTDYDRNWLWPMFDMCSAPQKLVHFPACYAMFVRGDVRPGSERLVFADRSSLKEDIVKVTDRQTSDGHGYHESQLLNSLPLAVVSGVQVEENPDIYPTQGKTVIRSESDIPSDIVEAFENKHIVSSTGELVWDWQKEGAGYFIVDTRNTKVFSGFVRDRSFVYRGMTLTPGKTRLDWMTLSLTLARASANTGPANLLRPGTYLLAASGLVQNTDMKVVRIAGNPERISISSPAGGRLGTAPVLCEGIEAEIALAGLGGRVSCFALDPDGNRKAEVPAACDKNGSAILKIGPQYRTVWYELIVD